MSDTEKAVAKIPDAKIGPMGIEIQNLDQMWWLSNRIMQSGMAPSDCKSAADLVVRAQFGMSVGLSYMQSIQAVANVNGRPCLWGPQVLGLIMSSGKCKTWEETVTGTDPMKDDYTVTITTERKDVGGIRTYEFSTAEARRAGLLGKNLYKTYPKDMLRHRAVARAAKSVYGDVLSGLSVVEEERDIIDIVAEPVVPSVPPKNLSDVTEDIKRRGRPAKPKIEESEPIEVSATQAEVINEEAPII